MIPKIKAFSLQNNYLLFAEFDDGKKVIYNINDDIEKTPFFIELKDNVYLYNSAQLDLSRTIISWTENIDLPSDIIYNYGKIIQ